MAASAAIPTPAMAMRWTWVLGAGGWGLGIRDFSFCILHASFSPHCSVLLLTDHWVLVTFSQHYPHDRVMQHGPEGLDALVVASRMHAVAEDDHMHLLFQINPQRGAGKPEVSDRPRGEQLPGARLL